jgi:predicted transcriptional regulator
MNATIVNNYFKALEALLTAGTNYAKAIKALVPEYAKASPEEKDAIRNRVAQFIGKKYGVTPKVMEKGSNKGLLGFDQHGSQAEKNARAFMKDNFSITKKKKKATATSSKVSPKVDKVEEALALVESLTKAQQAVFFKRVTRK